MVELDVGDAGDRAPRAVEAAGRIDVLVNNAGFGIVGAIEETSEAELRDAMEVMFFGPLDLTRLVLPQMRARRAGTVVQLTSMGGMLSFPGVGAYSAAKGALELASEALAAEVAPLGIKVLIVEPGAFRTGFAAPAALQAVDVAHRRLRRHRGRDPRRPADRRTARRRATRRRPRRRCWRSWDGRSRRCASRWGTTRWTRSGASWRRSVPTDATADRATSEPER